MKRHETHLKSVANLPETPSCPSSSSPRPWRPGSRGGSLQSCLLRSLRSFSFVSAVDAFFFFLAELNPDVGCVVVADVLHRRQLRQEAQLAADQPAAEAKVPDPGESAEKEMEGKLAGAVEPVRNSASIM